MIQFYLPDIEVNPTLPAEESGHCVRVLRMTVSDHVTCVDGRGGRYQCEIVEVKPKAVSLRILSCEQIEKHWPCKITLAIAPTKNIDRIEWLIEKCTEMGIDRIIPVKCAHSERKEIKPERLQRILVSAMKQSLKTTLPELLPMTPLTEVLKSIHQGQRFICYCADDVQKHDFCREYKAGSDVTILVGPEGDFSPEEARMAIDAGWIPATLGQSRLRTETAGLFAVASVHTINQMLQI